MFVNDLSKGLRRAVECIERTVGILETVFEVVAQFTIPFSAERLHIAGAHIDVPVGRRGGGELVCGVVLELRAGSSALATLAGEDACLRIAEVFGVAPTSVGA